MIIPSDKEGKTVVIVKKKKEEKILLLPMVVVVFKEIDSRLIQMKTQTNKNK